MKALNKENYPLKQRTSPKNDGQSSYSRFGVIDGSHPFKAAVPGGYVEYEVRTRHGGSVAYFNFALAKEMGLIAEDHPDEMNEELEKAIVHAFGIQIINEYDIMHKTPVNQEDIRPNRYMATRYLQLQHPDKRGTTSGDGRSIWNGCISHKGSTWDVSSCGTGATCLSPATAIEKKFFKTGTTRASYGCGSSVVSEGLSAAVMSEIFHKNGISTERSLAIVEFPHGKSINVRAGKNLIRPSHFFHHLRQENLPRLKGAIDYFIDRQVSNGTWRIPKSGDARYLEMTRQIATTFAKAAARFESDYIFVWLDWDGDNILASGGIIDYGSVRQFGLYHHEYRYDDVDRWSTTIPEQRKKARDIVQTFVQIRDYLTSGKRKSRSEFSNDEALKLFDREFEDELLRQLLHKIGFNRIHCEFLFSNHKKIVKEFKQCFSAFEKAKSPRGIREVDDGITCDAIFCMRDILRELPMILRDRGKFPEAQEFIDIMASKYATKKDKLPTPMVRKKIKLFEKYYQQMIRKVAKKSDVSQEHILLEMGMRTSVINKVERITGDSTILVTNRILKSRKDLQADEFQKLVEAFIAQQNLIPEAFKAIDVQTLVTGKPEKVLNSIVRIVRELRESI